MTTGEHYPVLLTEAVDAVVQDVNGIYVDATFGRGGHCKSLLSQLSDKARVIAFDKDPQAIDAGQALAKKDVRLQLVHDSFAALEQHIARLGLEGQISGVLLDLGVSSPQLDQSERGFSFMHDGPLDMRMNPSCGESAAQWLRHVSESELSGVLRNFGEERFAKRIARAIVTKRDHKEILRTKQLADIVAAANPKWEKGKHPATRSFQAIRIHINNELADLVDVLKGAMCSLKQGGRLVVISFHSLEDRIVKRFIKDGQRGDQLPANLPVRDIDLNRTLKMIGKPIKAGDNELDENTRSRSAVMRVAEKL